MKKLYFAIAGGASLLVLAIAAMIVPADASPSGGSAIGKVVGDFALTDQNGVAWTLRYNRTAPAIVLVTYASGDRYSRDAAKKLESLRASYPNVAFALIDSDRAYDRDAISVEAQAQGISLPLLDDRMQLIAESLGATRTGEAFLIDPKSWTVIYHGPVDVFGADLEAGGYLVDALNAHLAGLPIPASEVPVKGQAIGLESRGHENEWAQISYVKDVAPILLKNCVDCHEPGGIAPWQMTSYETVKGFSPMIREALRTDRMPPYNADPHVGEFKMDANLSEKDTKTLLHWIAAGSLRGSGEDPLKASVKPRPEWPLGKPDLVVDIPPYNLPATGVVDYQYPVVASPLKEGKWLKATTFKAGSRQGVHHILAGWIPKMPEGGRGFSWNVSMGGYAVGAESNLAPDGWGTFIPPGGAISLQMHYTPFGKAMTDYSKIGFYFLDHPPKYVMRQAVIADPTIVIPAGEARHHERGYLVFPAAVKLYGAQPHAHYRGYSSKLTLVYPNGMQKVILNLPQYDFNWQREYVFKDLIDVPAGSKLIADYIYDNSTNNKANPDPTKTIQWGEQSFQEMLFTAVRYRWADETADHRRDDLQKQLEESLLFTAIDDNIDGKLQLAELKSDMLAPLRAHFADFDTDHDSALEPQEFAAAMKTQKRGRHSSATD